jgi:hypothetical protein
MKDVENCNIKKVSLIAMVTGSKPNKLGYSEKCTM